MDSTISPRILICEFYLKMKIRQMTITPYTKENAKIKSKAKIEASFCLNVRATQRCGGHSAACVGGILCKPMYCGVGRASSWERGRTILFN